MKKDHLTQKYLDTWRDVQLSDSARTSIKENLLEYARFNDVREGQGSRSIKEAPRGALLISNIFNFKLSRMTLALLIAIMLSGGTTYAAEGAIPGDLLYGVKVGVNENIKSAFAISNESEAELQASLAEERLIEAEQLAAEGTLTSEVSTDITNRLTAHFEDAQARSLALQADGDFAASAMIQAQLEGTFRSYVGSLSALNSGVAGNDGSVLITNITTFADLSAASQVQATNTIKTSVEGKSATEYAIKETDSLIAVVEAKVSANKPTISAAIQTQIEAKLDESVRAQTEAKASLAALNIDAAYTSVQAAIRLASEAEAMTESTTRIQAAAQINSSPKSTTTTGNTNAGNSQDGVTTTGSTSVQGSASNTPASVDVKVDTNTNTTIDTGGIDVDVQSDTTINSALSL